MLPSHDWRRTAIRMGADRPIATLPFLFALFRSFRMALMALLPNLLPILIYFGILGWSGVTLNAATAIVACLVLGIAVDDTIHILVHFRASADRARSERDAALAALRSVARPITVTTIALCIGFSGLMASQLTSQFQMGWLCAVTLALAWIVDVSLTTALASRMRVSPGPEPSREETSWRRVPIRIGPRHRSGSSVVEDGRSPSRSWT